MSNREELAKAFAYENGGCGCDSGHLSGAFLAGFSAGVAACVEALKSTEAEAHENDTWLSPEAWSLWLLEKQKKGEL